MECHCKLDGGPTWTRRWKEVDVRHTIHSVVILLLKGVRKKHNKQSGRQRERKEELVFFSAAEKV